VKRIGLSCGSGLWYHEKARGANVSIRALLFRCLIPFRIECLILCLSSVLSMLSALEKGLYWC